MSIAEFFDYLIGRERTRDLGLQLALAYDERGGRRGATNRRS
jgi:hypothetical protein